jgi:hypothetical protein
LFMKKRLLHVFFSFLLVSFSTSLSAQQTFCTWTGPSDQQNCCGGLGTPPCGSQGSVSNIGSGTYTYLSLTAGKNYTLGSTDANFDGQTTLWYYTGSGNAMGNNGGWAPMIWADQNGPAGGSTFNFDAPYTSGNYILVHNRYNCQQHDFTGVSNVLIYRENGLPTLSGTATNACASLGCTGTVSLSMGGSCQTHTMTTGTFEQFNTSNAALNGYNGLWTYNGAGTANTDGSGQAYFYNGSQNSWTNAYYTNATVTRSEGLAVQGRFYNTGTYSMIGWHDGGTGTSYTDLVYAFYPAADGRLYIYEDGNYRTDVTGDGLPFVGGASFLNRWIEFKIVLHSGAAWNSGASYYIRNWTGNMADPWMLVYHSNYSAESGLRAGVANYYANNAYFYIDDMFMGGGTQYPPTSGLCGGTYTYAAQDQYGNLARANVTVGTDAASSVGTLNMATAVSCDHTGNIPQVSVSGASAGSYLWWDWGTAAGGWNTNWVSGVNAGTCCFYPNPTGGGAAYIRVRAKNGTCPEVTSATVPVQNQNSPAPTSVTAQYKLLLKFCAG